MPSTLSMDHVLTDQAAAGHSVSPGTFASHATGSAVDLRTAALLDPTVLLHGEHDMRRRGSDISRVRPVVVPDVPEEVELATLGPVPEDTAASFKDVESAAGSSKVSIQTLRQSETRDDADKNASSATIPFISAAQRKRQRRKKYICFAAMCWSFFLYGWNDSSTGPLLPTIQRYYDIGFAVVSLLFIFNTVGYLAGAIANVWLTDKLGLGRVTVLAASVQACAYLFSFPGGPFPLMCTAWVLIGFAQALGTSHGNGLVSCFKDPSTKLGFLHATYGLGAFTAPLVATHFAQMEKWYYHYLISLGIALSNIAFLCFAFRFKTQNEVLVEAGEAAGEADTTNNNKYKQIMGIRALHFLALWALIYVGVEVTLGGWIVTFIEQKRGGGASAGYISSGFFGGLMLGRVILIWLNRKIGERRVMFIYAFLAIQLEVTIWVVPSLVENALAVSFIGLLLGPMYPIVMSHSQKILPGWLFTGCVGWIAGIGQTGSAILPFATGLLASKFGIASLQPFIVSMMSTMVVIWAFVPRMRRVD